VLVLGRLAVALALVFSLASILFLALGVRRHSRELIRNGYFAVYGLFLSTVVASAVLLQAFLSRDFSFQYVFDNSDSTRSTFYRIAGFWAGQQGSLLLWMLFLTIVTVVVALRSFDVNERSVDGDRLTGGAVMVLAVIAAAFATLMVFDSSSQPFLRTPVGEVSPFGLNPLLLHPAMVLHPPALFLGYVGMAVPFAFAVSAMLLGQTDRMWVKLSQKWTVAGWLFLSLGIGLGAWWAYVVLSWGGYWGWDPVESTSLLPWLTATALLHSMNLYVRRGIFKRWTLALAAASFWLTLVATWTTRSGLITSVHAFAEVKTLVYILSSFVAAVAVVSIALLIWRWQRFREDHQVASLLSRDMMYSVTNVSLSMFAGAVLFAAVVLPLVTSNGRSVDSHTFNIFAEPLGVLVLLAIGVCPLLAWGHTEGRALWRDLRWPLGVAVLSVPLWLFTGNWRSSVGGFLGLVVCAFTAAAVIEFVILRARKSAGDASFARGLGRTLTFSRGRTAGIVAHIGMVLIMFGLLGSNIYKVGTNVFLDAKPGATTSIQSYTLKFVGFRTGVGMQNAQSTFATLDVYKNGTKVGVLEPHTDVYAASSQNAVRAVILGSWGQDLFVTPNQAFDKTSTQISLQMDIFPLVRLVWVGAIALCLGAAVSLWPKAEPKLAPADERAAQPVETA
jgi:cytochrome c-type biogenesis protein CcmF